MNFHGTFLTPVTKAGSGQLNKVFKETAGVAVMADKKGAPLPASSAGLLRFFEDETKGFKVDPRIVVSMPSGLIALSWALDLLLVK